MLEFITEAANMVAVITVDDRSHVISTNAAELHEEFCILADMMGDDAAADVIIATYA